MSERYTPIGSKGALLVMVLVVSVLEMTVLTEATTGECMKAKSTGVFICFPPSKLIMPVAPTSQWSNGLSLSVHAHMHSLFTPNLCSFEANKQQVETDDCANSHMLLQNLNIFMMPLERLPKLVW